MYLFRLSIIFVFNDDVKYIQGISGWKIDFSLSNYATLSEFVRVCLPTNLKTSKDQKMTF